MSDAHGSSIPADYVGVIQAARDKGLDPSKVVTCVPSAGLTGAVPGVRGCNVYDRCPFALSRYGGFKGSGPKTVGYYLKTNDGTSHQIENEMACFKFVFLMLERMRAGIRDREQGKRGNPGPELINIVAWEPGTFVGQTEAQTMIRTKIWVKKDPNTKDLNAEYVAKYDPHQVHAYMHPDDLQAESYENQLEREALERMRNDPDLRMGPPEMPDASVRLIEDDDEDTLPLTAKPKPVATAEPVKQ